MAQAPAGATERRTIAGTPAFGGGLYGDLFRQAESASGGIHRKCVRRFSVLHWKALGEEARIQRVMAG